VFPRKGDLVQASVRRGSLGGGLVELYQGKALGKGLREGLAKTAGIGKALLPVRKRLHWGKTATDSTNAAQNRVRKGNPNCF
jgi:hypothetical protein